MSPLRPTRADPSDDRLVRHLLASTDAAPAAEGLS